MALTKVDISIMDNVGTTANKLLAYDGSGNLPAVDGSQLINVSTGVTVSAIGGDNYERTRDMGPRKKKKSPGFSSYKVDGRKMKNQAQGISPFRKMYSI